MSKPLSFDGVFKRLGKWSNFPKYQLERRVDIFVTYFLERFFSKEPELLADGKKTPSRVKLVAPEFPILSQVCRLLPGEDGSAAWKLTDKRLYARTVNADYLLYRSHPHPAWVLLELKTDTNSFEEDQLERYLAARRLGMRKLLMHLRKKVLPKTDEPAKYEHLLRMVALVRPPDDADLEIVYLAPSLPVRKKNLAETIVAAAKWKYGDDAARFHALSSFADAGPFEPRELWDPLADLLRMTTRAK